MDPRAPEFTAHNTDEEPWRVGRLIRTDGRVRELLRMFTRDAPDSDGSLGEQVWARHVRRLHDERGTLQLHVTAALGASGWLAIIAMAAARAWDGEDETEVEIMAADEAVSWPLEAFLVQP